MSNCITLHANHLCQRLWKPNQKVSIVYHQDGVLVTSGQNCSTPGIKTSVVVHAGTTYLLEVYGYSVEDDNTHAFVWIYDPVQKKRLIPNYTMLNYREHCNNRVIVEFIPTRTGTIFLGVLITNPLEGQRFVLNKMNLISINSSSHQHQHQHHNHHHSCNDFSISDDDDTDMGKCPDEIDECFYRPPMTTSSVKPFLQPPLTKTQTQKKDITLTNLQTNLKNILDTFENDN